MLLFALALFVLGRAPDANAASKALVSASDVARGSHFSLDFDQRVPYSVRETGDRFTVTITGVPGLRIDGLERTNLKYVAEPRFRLVGDNAVLQFKKLQGATLRHFRDGNRIVFEVSPPAADTASAEAQPAPAAPNGAPVSVRVTGSDAYDEIRFDWTEMTGAAIFVRGGHLWAVFDQARPLRITVAGGAGRAKPAAPMRASGAAIARFKVPAGVGVNVTKDGNAWIVYLKDTPVAPESPLEITRSIADPSDPKLLIPVGNTGAAMTLQDPTVGDRLLIGTLRDPGRGVDGDRTYADVDLPGTAQGLVAVPKSDQVQMKRVFNGLEIGSAAGLALSPVTPGGPAPGATEANNASPIDFLAQSRAGAGLYTDIKDQLQYAISRANPKERNGPRWNLATFQLANGMSAETLGILKMMMREKPASEDSPAFKSVRGVAHLLMDRTDLARADLMQPVLDGDPFVSLWRTRLLEGAKDYAGAAKAFRLGRDVLGRYPDRYRAEFLLAAARAEAESGDTAGALADLDRLKPLKLTDRQKGDAALLLARTTELKGDASKAIAQYQDAERINDRRTRAVAGLSRTKIAIAQQTMTPDQAIDSLDRLRFVWRGDEIELGVLETLGDLYVKKGDLRMGLETYRAAAAAFPRLQEGRDLATKMTDLFRNIFVDGNTEQMDPVVALALYYDFRELTPLGAEGDQVIRRLADRLVAVDLLDRAEQLLDHQVFNRLEGVAKAQIAGQLAMIYIMDRKPEEALKVLRGTRQPLLPKDVQAQRNRIEARALAQKGEFEEAEVVIDLDKSAEAEKVRADIYWNSRNWKRFVEVSRAILNPKGFARLDSDAEEMVMRQAIALDFLDDHDGLVALGGRYKEQMRPSRYREAFAALTRPEERSTADTSLISKNLKDIQTLQNTMDVYRREFAVKPGAPAAKRPAAPAAKPAPQQGA